MDEYHDRFPVYDDVSSAGNHFPAFAKIPDQNAPVNLNGSSTNNPHTGATAIQCRLLAGGGAFGGFYFQNGILPAGATAPLPNFGTVPDAGINLSGATALSFWARGEQGGERVEFFMGGLGRNAQTGVAVEPFPDSTPRRPSVGTIHTLSTSWQRFTIDLTGADLSYVLGGFGWVASLAQNPGGATFYLDDIQYELSDARRQQRLNEPRFLRSFTTGPFQSQPPPVNDFDLVLRNSAFTYDNALALLAFLASGSADSLRRARLIGDAFIYASLHDRSYDDGRLRSNYAAGDISLPPGWTPNNRRGTVPVSGFQVEGQGFVEFEQRAVDTGNNAWAMIALLALYRRTSEPSYLDAARRLGNFIRTFRNDAGTFRGFQGGLDPAEPPPSPVRRAYASTEHNLDVYAAFLTMFQLTGEPQWLDDARHARQFVEAMFDTQRGCYLAGTTDPSTRNTNPGQLPLDAQAWSVLTLPDVLALHPQVLECVESNHRTAQDGFDGYDFNEDKDGVWFEGTAQAATALAFASRPAAAEGARQELRRAQQTQPFGDGSGVAAASRDGLTTGFDFRYFRRLHVGATAWNVFAQLGFNPYYQTPAMVVQMGNESLTAGEGIGSARVTVNRLGDTSGAATVRYATADGTASDRSDYTAALGTLRFAPGETTKELIIFITDDVNVEGGETVNITLNDVSGAALGTPSTTVLTISDNDTAGGSANPIDDPRFFVRQHYVDFLNREPDPAGLAFWTNQITECGTDFACVDIRRQNVSAAFFLSIEFQETGFFAYRMYKASYGDLPGKPVPLTLREFLPDTQQVSRGVQVGVGDWQTQLENNKNAFAEEFVALTRFTSAYPQSLTAAQFVDALNANAGGALSQAERNDLVTRLGAGQLTRAQVVRAVAEDADFGTSEKNQAFVLMQYFGYLRRNPNDAPELTLDFQGYNFWLTKLNNHGGNFVSAEMVKAFLVSGEYRQRFGQP